MSVVEQKKAAWVVVISVALFLAVGPAFVGGRTLGDFDNVDVYPLLRELIGLPPATGIDGSAARFAPVLKR